VPNDLKRMVILELILQLLLSKCVSRMETYITYLSFYLNL